MSTCRLLLLALCASLAACRESKPAERAPDLSKDSALAQDLKNAGDTSRYAEAADVAMREIPDPGLAPPTSRQPVTRTPAAATKPVTRPATTPKPATVTTPAPPPPTPAKSDAEGPMLRMPSEGNDVRPSIPANEPTVGACESPAAADQRRCLMSHLARSDAGLDRTYQALIAALKARDGSTGGEPASVTQLRTAQRAWLVYRDTECRRRNRGTEGALWAPTRARCLGEFSADREAELRAQLSALGR